jgi:hypothetical protein
MRPISVTLPNANPGQTGPAPITLNPPIRLDEWADAQVGVQVVVIGTATFTVQTSFDEGPDSLVNPIPVANMAWDSSLVPTAAVGGAAGLSFALGGALGAGPSTAPLWIRILLLSGSTGSVRMNVVQANVVTA